MIYQGNFKNNLIEFDCGAGGERLKFNVQIEVDFGQNRQIEVSVSGQNWGKPPAQGSSTRHDMKPEVSPHAPKMENL